MSSSHQRSLAYTTDEDIGRTKQNKFDLFSTSHCGFVLGRNLSRKDLLVLWSIKFYLCWVYTWHRSPYHLGWRTEAAVYRMIGCLASSDSLSFTLTTLTQFRCMQWITYHNMSPTWHVQLASKFKSTKFAWNNWKWKTGMSWLLCKIGCKSEMCTLIRLCTSIKYVQRRRLWANNAMPIFIDRQSIIGHNLCLRQTTHKQQYFPSKTVNEFVRTTLKRLIINGDKLLSFANYTIYYAWSNRLGWLIEARL